MNHLCEAAQRALELSDADRLQYILSDHYVCYPAVDAVMKELNLLLHHPKINRMPNRVIVSETNNGKTSVVRRFIQLHERADDPNSETTDTPILMIQAPPTPDRRAFLTSILDELHIPHLPSHRTEALFGQVKTIVPKLGVQMLIIDEIQHLIAGDNRNQRAFLNVLKYFNNEWKVPIVAVGTAEAYNAINADPQVANRFKPIELPRWKNNSDFRRLLRSFESFIPLKKPSDLSNPEMSLRLSLMSEGTIGELSTLLKEASLEAITGGEERITNYVLDRIGWLPPSNRKGRHHG